MTVLARFNDLELASAGKESRRLLEMIQGYIQRNHCFQSWKNDYDMTVTIEYGDGDGVEVPFTLMMDMKFLIGELKRELEKDKMALQFDEPEVTIDQVCLDAAVQASGLPDTMALRVAITVYLTKAASDKRTGLYIRHSTVFKSPAILLRSK